MPFKSERAKKAWTRRYYRANKAYLLSKSKLWAVDNNERKVAASKAWALANPDKIRQIARKYREKNRDEINRKKRERRRTPIYRRTAEGIAADLNKRAIALSHADEYGVIGKIKIQRRSGE